MAVALLPDTSLRNGGVLTVSDGDGREVSLPTFTCCHCNRIVVMHPGRRRGRNTCRRCMEWTCDAPGCVLGCHPFAADMERAYRGQDGQPWLLRSHGEPVDRIYGPNGKEVLVLRSDHNMNLRELERGKQPKGEGA